MSSSKKEFSSGWKYLKRTDSVVFLIGLIIGFVAVHLAYFSAAGRIGELEPEVNDFQDEIATAKSTLDHKNTQIAALQSEVQNKSIRISGLQSENAAKDAEISDLEAQISGRDSTIASLQSQISGLEQEIAGKDNMISNLEQEIEDLEFRILNLELRPEVLGPDFSPKTGQRGGCERKLSTG